MHPFRFGAINEQMDAPNAWRDRVQATEATGFDTLLIRDHFINAPFGNQYAPLIALMAAAACTSTLRLGTMVLANDFRHPALLAKEAATLDVFSGGRFELGIGAGWLRAEYEQAGIAFASNGTRIARLAEAVRVLKQLWRGEALMFQGEYYQIADLTNVPRPAQTPHIPLFLGGGHERMLTLAGQEADRVGLLTSSVASGALTVDPADMQPAAVERKLGWVRAGAGARFAQIELSLIPTLIVTDTRRQATDAFLAQRGWQHLAVETVWDMPSVLIGSIAQITEDLHARRERYGFSYYIFSDTQLTEAAPLVAALQGA